MNRQESHDMLPEEIQADLVRLLSTSEGVASVVQQTACPECLAELALLRDLEMLEDEPPITFPIPVLSFLTPERTAGLEPSWKHVQDWVYQIWYEGERLSRLVLRVADALAPQTPALTPLAVKGHVATRKPEIVQQVNLTPVGSDDLDVEAVVWKQADNDQHYELTVRVQIPSRWPELSGTEVYAIAAGWQAVGTTDSDGVVQFRGLPSAMLHRLKITISP